MPTPMWRQYQAIKKQYPDTIVLFRLGDFYETFEDDAKIAARELDLVLTSRPISKSYRTPMAGVPHHAADSYIARLINKGYRVAICEQTGDDRTQGLMERAVTRVVTPGTVVEPGLLDEKRNNYLAAVVVDGARAGLAYADSTTGEFATTQLTGDDVFASIRQELERLQPAEVLVEKKEGREGKDGKEGRSLPLPSSPSSPSFPSFHQTPYPRWHFDLDTARRALQEHFGVQSLEGFGCERLPLATQAAGAIIQYLGETQKAAIAQFSQLSTYSTHQFMNLDPATRRNLELTQSIRGGTVRGSLLAVLDQTVTPMGGRLLRQWINEPLLDINNLNERLDAVAALHANTILRTELRTHLKEIGDLERLTNRVLQRIASPRDLQGLRRGLETVPQIIDLLGKEAGEPGSRGDKEQGRQGAEEARRQEDFSHLRISVSPCLPCSLAPLLPCDDVVSLTRQAISEDAPGSLGTPGVIAPGFSAELDGIHAASKDARTWVASLEKVERERTGIRSLKVGFNKVFGYYIEVSHANRDLVPEDYIRKQTLVNAERYITSELKEYESLILNAEERIVELEGRIFRQVLDQVAAAADRLLTTARALAHLDVYANLAEVALRHRYVRSELSSNEMIHIQGGRHPVVELTLRDHPFVPNDTHLASGDLHILTGPNMSGKSTFLRQVAIITLMAQIGSFVPADAATIGLVDRIFTRIGAQDEIAAGQSTFMVEMVETANILHHATSRSLVILDEIGRGTSTYDGISIAWAVVEYLHNAPRLRPKTLFATHYHELTELANLLPRVHNYNVAVAEEGDRVIFLHKIVPGGADRSYGIHVARLAGLPKAVIHRAEELLQDLETAARAPGAAHSVKPAHEVQQLSLFAPPHPLVEEVKQLDINSMTPLEALTKLFELQRRLQQEDT
ncbi:MAG: DNA mismatch repair protein MutS [Chloroflexi bacterium RBG_16_57_9]|nr:MAG: DNA mismatch repair protein MutS [Chloroflexi bacterium RBG_16_57_9]